MSTSTEFVFLAEFELPMAVVNFSYHAEMNRPYSLAVLTHVREDDATLSPDEMVGGRCTLRIATNAAPDVRCLHGMVIEAAEVGVTEHGVLYRFEVQATIARSNLRVRSRIFVEKTLRQIIDLVLTDDPLQKQAQQRSPTTQICLHRTRQRPSSTSGESKTLGGWTTKRLGHTVCSTRRVTSRFSSGCWRKKE